MWKINYFSEKIDLNIDISSLLKIVIEYEGIFLFSSRITSGKNIVGLNPLIKIKEKELIVSNKIENIDNPFFIIDNIMNKNENPENKACLLGYISYDYKNNLEEPGIYKDINQGIFPDIYFVLFEYYLFFHTGSNRIQLIKINLSTKYKQIDIQSVLKKIEKKSEIKIGKQKSYYIGTSLPIKDYETAVQKTIDYIKAGDIYQANITRSVSGETELSPHQIGYSLYHSNRIDFGVFALVEGNYIISTSPERFFKITGNKIITSPIKGTIEKTESLTINEMKKKELFCSTKNRAELAMIVDLLRNDISKFCKQGTVKVRDFPILKELDNVFHLVSDIEGVMYNDISFEKIIRSIFPGGSISGCPKIRACQIIEELEKEGRGIYTGSFGYYSFNKNMDFNIMIRSLFLTGNKFIFNIGGGITLLSNPKLEYEETIYKAKNIYDAIFLEEVWEERYCLMGK